MTAVATLDVSGLIWQAVDDYCRLMERLRAISRVDGNSPLELLLPALAELDRIYNNGTAAFGRIEHSVIYAEEAGYLEKSLKNRVYVGDIAEALRNIASFYTEIHRALMRLNVPDIHESYPRGDAYGGMQAVIKMFRPDWVDELRQLLINANIPTMGFDEELSPVKAHVVNSGINIQNSVVNAPIVNDSFNMQQVQATEKFQSFWKIWRAKLIELPIGVLTTVIASLLLLYLGLKK